MSITCILVSISTLFCLCKATTDPTYSREKLTAYTFSLVEVEVSILHYLSSSCLPPARPSLPPLQRPQQTSKRQTQAPAFVKLAKAKFCALIVGGGQRIPKGRDTARPPCVGTGTSAFSWSASVSNTEITHPLSNVKSEIGQEVGFVKRRNGFHKTIRGEVRPQVWCL